MQEEKEEEWKKFCAENEPQFLDLIETDDWHLLGQEGVELIVIPIFSQDSDILWRWSVYPGTAR